MASIRDIKGETSINGVTVQGNFKNLLIKNNKLYLDGVLQDGSSLSPNITIVVNGSTGDISSGSGDVNVKGNSNNINTGSGDVDIGNSVSGNIKTGSGDVDCDCKG